MSMDLFAVAAVVLIVILAGVLFFMPTERVSRKTLKKIMQKEESVVQKDWQEACLKMEKHIHGLRAQLEKGKIREKNLEKELLIQKMKIKKMQEKMSQERGWQEKELTDIEKKTEEVIRLKEDLKSEQEELAKEHGERLRLERELKEVREALGSATDVQRTLEIQIAKLNAQLDNNRKELIELRSENAQLSKKHDEATWIAKSEYVRLEQQLRKTQKEFEEFKSHIRRDGI
jgi:chromosome segregation ATPase